MRHVHGARSARRTSTLLARIGVPSLLMVLAACADPGSAIAPPLVPGALQAAVAADTRGLVTIDFDLSYPLFTPTPLTTAYTDRGVTFVEGAGYCYTFFGAFV